MNNPIISAEEANRLNLYFQQQVDPRLFLFCNYEPTLPRPLSEDGAFYANVQDLYKFAIDSSCIVKEYYKYLPADKKTGFKDLEKILDTINMMRSMTDHNQSIANGKYDSDTISSYSMWMEAVIGKEMPTTIYDFQKINQKLASMATSLIALLEKFVDTVGSDSGRQLLVSRMINRILLWYSSNTKTRFYEGQLLDTYMARANAAGRTYVAYKPAHILRVKVGKWIEAAQLFLYDQKSTELKEDEKAVQDSLKRIEDPNNPFVTLISEEKREEILTNLRQQLKTCREAIKKNEEERYACNMAINHNPYDYLFKSTHSVPSRLVCQLEETMERLEQQGVCYTLLPQDLMQEDIEYRFAGVSSPEQDF